MKLKLTMDNGSLTCICNTAKSGQFEMRRTMKNWSNAKIIRRLVAELAGGLAMLSYNLLNEFVNEF